MTSESTSLEAQAHRGTEAGTDDRAEQAKQVVSQTADRVGDVAGDVGAHAKVVVRDAKDHARQLVDQGRQHLDDEAQARSQQAAGGLRALADQLGALSDGADERAGALGDYARQGREQLTRLADRLDEGPAAVLDDVRSFARRQPVIFLAAAGAVGFVAGRLIRSARDAAQDGADRQLPAPATQDRPSTPPAPQLGAVATNGNPAGVPATAAASPLPVEDLAP
jgi:ElaB/YqjD/DUF883 family membrane-anchored ribosome-binding protein